MAYRYDEAVLAFAEALADLYEFAAPDELRGCMDDGYTPDEVNSVLGQLSAMTGLRLVCIWDYYDEYGYGGNSEFYIEALDGKSLFKLAGNLWAWLSKSVDDPRRPRDPRRSPELDRCRGLRCGPHGPDRRRPPQLRHPALAITPVGAQLYGVTRPHSSLHRLTRSRSVLAPSWADRAQPPIPNRWESQMAAKATLRRNGRHMFTVRARFDIDVNELINRITEQISMFGDDMPTSRAAALDLARRHCTQFGSSREPWGEDDEDWPANRAVVCDCIRQIFPELAREITETSTH